ncbi:TolC family protein [Pontiella agarivorans]|uniref:TolC family protein n=1 Tax=Pontiella agarivorans TaxID=3038953 RepID=A0ABU5MZ69_9BACT|nr:TolC family protein [Pontiella agarivorans]MDZ8119490.1 TolC family protein [Pontiella agarivorans]
MKLTILWILPLLLAGCVTRQELPELKQPDAWEGAAATVTTNELSAWWTTFNDPALTGLVETALTNSPQQQIAAARIREARGIRRSAKAGLFPSLGIRGDAGREREALTESTGNFYTAGFDASYEVDLFGKNRNTLNAADAQLRALEADLQGVELSLAAEVVRTYIDFRAAEKQRAIAGKNLKAQENTLKLVQQQHAHGEAPRLDVERSESLVNTTRASIPEFRRLAENARLQLAVLTGRPSQELRIPHADTAVIPGADSTPLLLAPVDVMAGRPDIRRAAAVLEANSALVEVSVAELYPTISLSGFFGFADGVLFDSARIWQGAIDGAVNLIDFGRVEGQIDAAEARERQAYEQLRQTVLQAVADVESAMTDYARIREQRGSLEKAYKNSARALKLSEALFREGEVSFLDVLDAQRTANDADSALVSAEAAQAKSVVRLYKSLGIY